MRMYWPSAIAESNQQEERLFTTEGTFGIDTAMSQIDIWKKDYGYPIKSAWIDVYEDGQKVDMLTVVVSDHKQIKENASTVKQGLECCQLYADANGFNRRCGECPYSLGVECIDALHKDMLKLLENIICRKADAFRFFDHILKSLREIELDLEKKLCLPKDQTLLLELVNKIEIIIAAVKQYEDRLKE